MGWSGREPGAASSRAAPLAALRLLSALREHSEPGATSSLTAPLATSRLPPAQRESWSQESLQYLPHGSQGGQEPLHRLQLDWQRLDAISAEGALRARSRIDACGSTGNAQTATGAERAPVERSRLCACHRFITRSSIGDAQTLVASLLRSHRCLTPQAPTELPYRQRADSTWDVW